MSVDEKGDHARARHLGTVISIYYTRRLFIHTHTHSRTNTHTLAHKHTCTHSHTHTHALTYTLSHTHTQSNSHSHPYTHKHTLTLPDRKAKGETAVFGSRNHSIRGNFSFWIEKPLYKR